MAKTMDQVVAEKGMWIPVGQNFEYLTEGSQNRERSTTVTVKIGGQGYVNVITEGPVSINTNGGTE